MKTIQEKYEKWLSPWINGTFDDIEDQDPSTGRKRKIKSPNDMAKIACDYFVEKEGLEKRFSYTELSFELGLLSCIALDNYKKYSKGYKSLVNRIKSIINERYQDLLFDKGGYHPARFVLTCNYGWTETSRQIIEDDKVYNINIAGVTDKSKEERERLNKKYNE